MITIRKRRSKRKESCVEQTAKRSTVVNPGYRYKIKDGKKVWYSVTFQMLCKEHGLNPFKCYDYSDKRLKEVFDLYGFADQVYVFGRFIRKAPGELVKVDPPNAKNVQPTS